MRELEDVKVGDQVTVFGHFGGAQKIVDVVRVTKTKIVTGDAEEWSVSGRLYGSNSESYYTGPSIYKTKPEHKTAVRRNRLVHVLTNTLDNPLFYKQVSLETLEQIYAAALPWITEQKEKKAKTA